jgi:Holliday junction resolvase RusA-like endonuclease
MHTYNDYDNILKPISDALQDAGVINNDRNIHAVDIEKYPIKRGQLGSLSVYIAGGI